MQNFILASHNSWSYLRPRKLWQRPFAFVGRCQRLNIRQQYEAGVRCFDLRVRFDKDSTLPMVCHGAAVYDIAPLDLMSDLEWLDQQGDVSVRVMLEVRTKKQDTKLQTMLFRDFCDDLIMTFPKIEFWGFRNVRTWQTLYFVSHNPTCKELHASVTGSIIDDWLPWLYAKRHNRKNIAAGTDRDILMIDFIDIR